MKQSDLATPQRRRQRSQRIAELGARRGAIGLHEGEAIDEAALRRLIPAAVAVNALQKKTESECP